VLAPLPPVLSGCCLAVSDSLTALTAFCTSFVGCARLVLFPQHPPDNLTSLTSHKECATFKNGEG
jgi:hypothetical protein